MAAFLAITVAVAAGILVMGEDKSSIGVLLSVYLVLVYLGARVRLGFAATNRWLRYVIIASLPFPYLIQYQGKDAMTVTTLFIFCFLSAAALESCISRKPPKFRRAAVLALPLVLAVSFTVTMAANTAYLGQAVRYYLANLSGIGLFFILVFTVNTKQELCRIIKLIVIMLACQAVIAFLQLKYPDTVGFLSIFGTRTDNPQGLVTDGVLRATGTVWDYELLAEWFLVGSILSLYLVYETRNFGYLAAMLATVAGLVFTKTRSDAMLFAAAFAGIFLALKLLKKDRQHILAVTAGALLAAAIAGAAVFPDTVKELSMRMQMFLNARTPISAEAINRKEVWANAASLLRDPTLIGAGLHNVEVQYEGMGSFHSLYLTLLYKTGFLGMFLHIVFWLLLLKMGVAALLSTSSKMWYAVFFLIAAAFVLLVDGIKIEYLRYAHTIQFVWMVLGLACAAMFMRQDQDSLESARAAGRLS